MGSEQKVTQEEIFRNGLEALVDIAEKLSPICNDSISELIELAKLGLSNQAQCKLLLKEMNPTSQRR